MHHNTIANESLEMLRLYGIPQHKRVIIKTITELHWYLNTNSNYSYIVNETFILSE